ncbi:unnamed protein product [Caenorhabditis sp. 36 PRJEB53466]|nr:unnamed protein product [Caenorhabditis sp. 36 PRJEB53466]
MNNSNVTPKALMTVLYTNTTTHPLQLYFNNKCAYFYYNNWALMMWVTASVFCFLALVSTIWTIYQAHQLWSTFEELEHSLIDFIDETCQILLPLGICKQICHPHHIGNLNANYPSHGQKSDFKPGKKENRYPEDVTFPPSDIERVYDVMGDEEARKSRIDELRSAESMSQSIKEKPKESEPVKLTPSRELQLQATPTQSREQVNVLSREPHSDKKKPSSRGTQKATSTPKHSTETPNRTPSREKFKSREAVTPREGMSRENLNEKKNAKMSTEAFKSREPSRESANPKSIENRKSVANEKASLESTGAGRALSKESVESTQQNNNTGN